MRSVTLRQVGRGLHLLDSHPPDTVASAGSADGMATGPAPAGPPMVLLHDLDASAAVWCDVTPALATQHRVLAPDLPGAGRSPAGRRVSMTAHADVVAEVVRQCTDGPVTLVGHSMGALIALLTAARHPWAARGVVLLAPALPRRTEGGLDPAFVPLLTAACVPGMLLLEPWRRSLQPPERRVGDLLEAGYAPDSERPSQQTMDAMIAASARRTRTQQLRGWPGAARSLFWWLSRPRRFHETADQVAAPVTLVEGVEDPVLPRAMVREALARHPDWTHVALAGVGHLPQLERPIAVVDTLRAAAAR